MHEIVKIGDRYHGIDPQGWLVEMIVDESALPVFESVLDRTAEAISYFEIPGRNDWRLEAYYRYKPDSVMLETELTLAAAHSGRPGPKVCLSPLSDVDWVTANQANFPPFRIGCFYIYGSHVKSRPPLSAFSLLVEAGAAFGTGEHATTATCLKAIDAFAQKRPPYKPRPLDVGCGTGILTMAMAKRFNCLALGLDIDPMAVQVTYRNAHYNRLSFWRHGGPRIQTLRSVGLRHRVLNGRYDPIIANILAKPLCQMARALRGRLRPGGRLILSGLRHWQEASLLSVYRRVGLYLQKRITDEGWVTLILQ